MRSKRKRNVKEEDEPVKEVVVKKRAVETKEKEKVNIASIIPRMPSEAFVHPSHRAKCVSLIQSHLDSERSKKLEMLVYIGVNMNRKMYKEKMLDILRGLATYPHLQHVNLHTLVAMESEDYIQKVNTKESEADKKDSFFADCSALQERIEKKALDGNTTTYLVCIDKACRSENVESWQEQRKSGDEGMSTFCKCKVCGKRWRFN